VEIYDEAGNLVIRLAQEIPTNGSPTVSASFDWPGTDAQGLPLPYGRYAPFFDAEAEGYVRLLKETCSGIWILVFTHGNPPDILPPGEVLVDGWPPIPPIRLGPGEAKSPETPIPPFFPPEKPPLESGPKKPDITIAAPPRAKAGPQGAHGRPGPDTEGACML